MYVGTEHKNLHMLENTPAAAAADHRDNGR
jgi:hypothetical protein